MTDIIPAGLIKVPMQRIKKFVMNRTGFGDGVADQSGESPVLAMLTHDLTFKASFIATFLIGLINT